MTSSFSKIHIKEYEEDVILSKSSGNNGVAASRYREFVMDRSNEADVTISEIRNSGTRARQWWLRAPVTVFRELFLPIGYPNTVKSGYLEYQLYDSLQGLCSYLRGVLCSAQVLQAAGVGNENATAWGAALTWALKDGMGMIGGLFFSYLASPYFDAYTKEFRLFADVINDVALTLDMLAPYSPSLLLISSASTLCKALCGMSAAATKSNITLYFASEGNMADLNAKESTQETLVSFTGMVLGVTLATQLQRLQQHSHYYNIIQWTIFLIFTAIHVWSNWKGVSLLHLPTLNRERAEIVLSHILVQNKSSSDYIQLKSIDQIQFPSPDQIRESMLVSVSHMLWSGKMQLGARFADMVQTTGKTDWMQDFADERYFLVVRPTGIVRVCLLLGATPLDELKAFCHAYLLIHHCRKMDRNDVLRYKQLLTPLFQGASNSINIVTLLKEKGWDVEGRLHLGFPRRRTEWLERSKDD